MIGVVKSLGRSAVGRQAALIFLSSLVIGAVASATSVAQLSATPPSDTSPCTRTVTHAALNSFLADFNRGAYASLDSLFAQPPAFQWYSSARPGRRLGAGAKRRSTLIDYFRSRHAKHDQLRLLRFYFSGNAPHWSNFWFEAIRSADGFNHGDWRGVVGKGAAVCEEGAPQLIVLSLGGPRPGSP